jgi:hypothetical protein
MGRSGRQDPWARADAMEGVASASAKAARRVTCMIWCPSRYECFPDRRLIPIFSLGAMDHPARLGYPFGQEGK